MGKKNLKHERKISDKKKRKKEKKKHKERKRKHHRKRSSSSDDGTLTDSSNSRADKAKDIVKKTTDTIQDEIGWTELFSERHTITREKNEAKKGRYVLDKPGQSARELNSYWKDGGNGLPPVNVDTSKKSEKSYDIKSLKKLLQKAKDTADVTGIPLAQIIQEEWGSLEKLKQIIEFSEGGKMENVARSFEDYSSPSDMRSQIIPDGTSTKLKFMKPEDGSCSHYVSSNKQNWKKKIEKQCKPVEEVEEKGKYLKEEDEVTTFVIEKKSIPTADELNALAAKKIKAEIMGNKSLADKLERQIEDAKKDRREQQLSAGGSKPKREKEEVVVVEEKGILEKLRKPCEVEREGSRKRQRGETHRENERLRYYMDDDKHSLKSMFEREKLGSKEESNELLKLAGRGKYRSNNDNDDLDGDFLDRVRCSDYVRKETDEERKKIREEAKRKHKSLSHCRWCLDGNNVEKHLIISVGTNCYLCLPSDKSLTNGHCLIVPVHHDTCGTQLDEDVWNEMHSFRRRLCRMFEDEGQDVVFFENARSFNHFPHMVLHCVPMDKEIGDLAPIYFKKAIMESETEWSNNKKLIDLRHKDLRRSVPKGLPYFTIDFGCDGGYAHVIEDERLFPRNFAEEIIGGMLDLDAVNWRKRRRESLECQKEKVEEFLKRWKKYEGRECSNKRKSDETSSDSAQ